MVYRGVQTGWQFYWSNDMASPGPSPDPNERFDLIGIWFAYEDRADGEAEDWAPVWYYSKLTVEMEDGEPTFATGDIHRPQKVGQDQVVGNMDVRFSSLPDGSGQTPSSREAWLSVRMGDDSGNGTFDEGELLAVRDFILDGVIFDSDWFYDNPHDHFRGIWAEDGELFSADDGSIIDGANHILTEWIVGDMLSWAVLGFDEPEDPEDPEHPENANPIWLISFKCANGADSADCGADTFDELQHQNKSQFNTVYPGHPPFGETLVEDRDNGSTPSNVVEAGWGFGVSRYYKGTDELNVPLDHNALKSCIDLHGQLSSTEPTYSYNFSFGDGSCSASTLPSGDMSKVANRHYINFTIGGSYDERFCRITEGSGSGMGACEIELEWSTDDDFGQYAGPSAVPMVTREGESPPVDLDQICEGVNDNEPSYSSTGVTCAITEPGEYRLRLVSRPEEGPNPESGENEWQWADGTGPNGAQSSVIATSDLLHVSGPIPSEPEIAPVGPAQPPADDPAFFCSDGSSDCSGNDLAQEVLATSEVGGTRGDFRVTESGAAEYTLPIMTAKGVAGVEPEIALQYNSQRTDDGPMGRGWNVSGLSAINRCGQTSEVDGKSTGVTLTSSDRFCLDGQRLILIGAGDYGADGTEYRLEVDNLTRVKAHSRTGVNGIAYFEVLRSDGSRSLYGHDPNTLGSSPSAEVLAPVQDKPFVWPISRFSDNLGNYIQFEYAQPSVGEAGHEELIQWLPKAIRYTGFDGAVREEAPFARIEFTYEYRSPDGRPKRLLEGNQLYSTRLLEKVTSYSDGLVLRVYKPDYETDDVSGADLMQSLTECYSNRGDPTQDASINCLPGVQFNWTLPGSHWASYGEAPGVPEQFGLTPNFRGASAANFDGDEREEVLYVRAGYENRATFVLAKNVTSQGEDALDLDLLSNFIAVCNAKYSDLGGWLTADITGNGRAELVYAVKNCRASHPNGPGVYYHTWDSQSGGLSEQATHLATLPTDSQYSTSENNRLNVADVNGDGRLDLMLSMVETYSSQFPKIWHYRNDTMGQAASFSGPYDVVANISGAFEGEICGPNCEYRYGFEIFDSPVAAVDQSGAAGLLARATRREVGPVELEDINAIQQSTGREFVTEAELLNILSSGSGSGDTSVRSEHSPSGVLGQLPALTIR
ncbi:MAG: SpvB/TcaC N-terminal domain-containing protein [Xanthomonadales bacterium]|nr:SpvB/TcaC N-terminal domain-containing protein [Xanthomonadales bacterium]